MKKITLMMFALAATFTIQAQQLSQDSGSSIVTIPATEADVVLTQSVGIDYLDAGVMCGDQANGITAENFFFRMYDFADHNITGNVGVNAIEFIPATLLGETEVTAYVWEFEGFPAGFDVTDLPTPLAVGYKAVTPADIGTRVRVEFEVPLVGNEDSVFVIAINNPDGDPMMFLSTTAEQTAPTWLAGEDCGISTPTLVDAIGFPEAKHVIDLVIDDALSVNDVLSKGVSVYPNPSSNVFNISLPSNVEVLKSSLVDILGKTTGVVYSNGQMNVSALAPGIYFINLETNVGSYNQKVVVKQ